MHRWPCTYLSLAGRKGAPADMVELHSTAFSLHPVLVVGVRHSYVFKLEESSGKAPGKLRLNRRDTSAGHIQLLVLEVLLCHLST